MHKLIKQHSGRFTQVRLIEMLEDKCYQLAVYSAKRNTVSSFTLVNSHSMEAAYRFRVLANWLQENPGMLPNDFSFLGAENAWRARLEEQNIRYDLFNSRVASICYELGLDHEDRELNNWDDQRTAANAEYDLAASQARALGYQAGDFYKEVQQ
jgi:hypothetical protein